MEASGEEATALAAGVAELGLRLPPPAEERLLAFLAELRRWNRAYNLVAEAPVLDWVRSHLLDSLSIAAALRAVAAEGDRSGPPAPGEPSRAGSPRSREDGALGSTGSSRERLPGSAGIPARAGVGRPEAAWPGSLRSRKPPAAPSPGPSFRVLDLGSGAGLPGIPLAVALPELRFVLLDGNGKKARFCRHAVRALGLPNVEVVEGRVEGCARSPPFDAAVVRAVGSLARVRRLVRPCCRGPILAMKGRYPARELEELEGVRFETARLRVPGLEAERHLVILR